MPHGADPATMFADEPDFLTASITYSVPAAGIVAHRQIAAAHLDDHAGRELAAFRSLCRYVHRIPVEQRPGYLLDLARQLHIEPADAAALTAEQNPHIVMDRITQHARQLDQMITPTLTCTDGDHSAVNSLDQLGRPTLSR